MSELENGLYFVCKQSLVLSDNDIEKLLSSLGGWNKALGDKLGSLSH